MRAKLITLDLAGLALHGLYKLSCVAILYFLADAVFYQGEWRNVAYAGVVAIVMNYVARAYDVAFIKFVETHGGEDGEPEQQEFKFSAQPKRRSMLSSPIQSNGRSISADYAQLG